MEDAQGQWPAIARNWRRIGPPLRPVAQDLAFCQQAIDRWQGPSAPAALVMGVTPEYTSLAWPAATRLRAVDRTAEMIEHIWPGEKGSAILGRWEALPLDVQTIDISLCDGGLTLLDFPHGLRQVAAELSRVVRKGGLCVFRLYCLPSNPETPEQVRDALFAGHIVSLNQLKLRLGMALQPDAAAGVRLDDVYRHIMSWSHSLSALAAALSWDPDLLLAIEAYRGLQTRYHFTNAAQAIDVFVDTGAFALQSIDYPDYASGGQFPTIAFVRL